MIIAARAPGAVDAGFSLVELLVVLAIVSLAVAVAMPSVWRPSPVLEMRAAAIRLSGALRTARAQAVLERRTISVTFNVQERWYQIQGGTPIALPSRADVTVVVAHPFVRSTEEGSVAFFADGSATGGRISLSRNRQSTTIVVDWLTGLARIENPAHREEGGE